jgi:hypothetical protein
MQTNLIIVESKAILARKALVFVDPAPDATKGPSDG